MVCDRIMTITLATPAVDDLGDAVAAVRSWQHEGAPMQLHSGDIGWFQRSGAVATAAALRTWSRNGEIVAVGLLDEPDVLRMTIAPDLHRDEELGDHLAADVSDPERGVLPSGKVNIEAPRTALLHDLLAAQGWPTDEPWTPLRRDLTEPVEDPGVRIEIAGHELAAVRVAVHRAAFDNSTFTVEKWETMAAGPAYSDARCLVAFDDDGSAVAGVTVWSSGAGKPGLIEPLGAHRDHRGHGYGRAMSLAAAKALQEMGASSVIVCTPSSNVGGVAAYLSAGMQALPEVRDRMRTS